MFICLNYKVYLSKLQSVFVKTTKCICQNYKVNLSKLQCVFVQTTRCIFQNYKVYLSKLQSVFVKTTKCMCSNHKVYFSMNWSSVQQLVAAADTWSVRPQPICFHPTIASSPSRLLAVPEYFSKQLSMQFYVSLFEVISKPAKRLLENGQPIGSKKVVAFDK